MGRADLIGPGKQHLIPAWQPLGTGDAHEGRRSRHAPHSAKDSTPVHGKRRHETPSATPNAKHAHASPATGVSAKRGFDSAASVAREKRSGAPAALNAKRAGAPQAAPSKGQSAKPMKFRTQHTGLKGVRMPRSK
jgi:hypothetical protein